MNGSLVFDDKLEHENSSVDIAHLPKGTYICQLIEKIENQVIKSILLIKE
jgi:hypothetical protein